MKLVSTLLATLALSTGLSLHAMAADDMSKQGAMGEMKSSDATALMASGEVKKVDKDAGKITIKHGPLTNLEMPAMTMVFRVKDPVTLDQVTVGDKIGFVAERINGAITVTKLEPAK